MLFCWQKDNLNSNKMLFLVILRLHITIIAVGALCQSPGVTSWRREPPGGRSELCTQFTFWKVITDVPGAAHVRCRVSPGATDRVRVVSGEEIRAAVCFQPPADPLR